MIFCLSSSLLLPASSCWQSSLLRSPCILLHLEYLLHPIVLVHLSFSSLSSLNFASSLCTSSVLLHPAVYSYVFSLHILLPTLMSHLFSSTNLLSSSLLPLSFPSTLSPSCSSLSLCLQRLVCLLAFLLCS